MDGQRLRADAAPLVLAVSSSLTKPFPPITSNTTGRLDGSEDPWTQVRLSSASKTFTLSLSWFNVSSLYLLHFGGYMYMFM